MICLLLVATCAVFAQQPAPVAAAPASRADILRLFRAMDTQAQMRQVMSDVMHQMGKMNREQLQKRHPGITEDELKEMDREFEEVSRAYPIDQLMDDMIPVYQKHLTKADVNSMIAFYSSPTGKKLLHEMPAMTSEAMQAAYPRMQKSLDDIMKRMDEKANQEHEPTKTPSEQK
jgi:uncharacterized protein